MMIYITVWIIYVNSMGNVSREYMEIWIILKHNCETCWHALTSNMFNSSSEYRHDLYAVFFKIYMKTEEEEEYILR